MSENNHEGRGPSANRFAVDALLTLATARCEHCGQRTPFRSKAEIAARVGIAPALLTHVTAGTRDFPEGKGIAAQLAGVLGIDVRALTCPAGPLS